MNVGGDRCVFYLTDGVIQDVADVGKEVADVDFYLSPDKFSACQSAFQSKRQDGIDVLHGRHQHHPFLCQAVDVRVRHLPVQPDGADGIWAVL